MKNSFLTNCLLAVITPGALLAEDHTAGRPGGPSAALALLHEELPSRLEIDVAIGGASLDEVWDRTFEAIFKFADTNANGLLEDDEVALLPSSRALKLALGSGFAPPVGSPVSPDDLRKAANGRIAQEQVAEYYRQHEVGTVLIGIGELKSAPVLSQALLRAMDSDQDGSVSHAEWGNAPETLIKLDTNDDELVGAGEIVPNMLYPGAAGTMWLKSSTNRSDSALTESSAPVVLLPRDRSDERWMKELVHRGVGANVDQLRSWRGAGAAAHWDVHIDVGDAAANSFSWSSNKLLWQGWLAAGSLAGANRSVGQRVMEMLEASAATSAESSGVREPTVDWLVPIADRDRDGKVSRAEADQWCDLQAHIIRGQVLVSILWGGGLFEILDKNHDGALAIRELRSAWQVINEAGCVTAGCFELADVPPVMLAIVSHGYPASLTRLRSSGPGWARAMDRNEDGDISRREFSGPAEAFQRMDLDRDGLVDAREAAQQSQPGR